MRQFSQLREKMVDQSAVLAESLDTAVDFYMTDDTKMPTSIFGAFELDGTQYGVSLEESNFSKVYLLKVYRIVNAKVRLWSFIKPTHFRPALATVLKFMEASIPFLHSKMDGIIIQIPGKLQPDKLNRLLEYIVKKSFTKTFRSVRVVSSDKEQAYNFAFIVRKTVSPSALFSSKSFSKYSFDDVKPGEMPVAAAEAMQTKMKLQKTMVTVEPSKKFSFKGIVVKNAAVDAHDAAAKVINAETKLVTVEPEHAGKPIEDVLKSIASVAVPVAALKAAEAKPVKAVVLPLPDAPVAAIGLYTMALLLMEAMPKMTSQIKASGYSESKFDPSTFIYVLKKTMGTNLGAIYFYYKHKNYLTELDNFTDSGLKSTKLVLSEINDIMIQSKLAEGLGTAKKVAFEKEIKDDTKAALEKLAIWGKYFDEVNKTNEINAAFKKAAEPKKVTTYGGGGGKNSHQVSVTYKTSYDTEETANVSVYKPAQSFIDAAVDFSLLKSELPGEGTYVAGTDYYGHEVGEKVQAKVTALKKAGWGEKGNLQKKGIKAHSYSNAHYYTGSGSSVMNDAMRNIFAEHIVNDSDLKSPYNHESVMKRVATMQKAFSQIEPFPFDVWVYRGASLGITPESEMYPGKLYVDPAFLSTALHSTNTHGMGNVKHRIFIPKGSHVLPMLNDSNHPGENEIILPASSVLKIIKYDKITEGYGNYYLITSIYTGYVGDDMIDKYKQKFKVKEEDLIMAESKKPTTTKEPKYDPNKKFGGPVNAGFSKKVGAMIKKGELKVKK